MVTTHAAHKMQQSLQQWLRQTNLPHLMCTMQHCSSHLLCLCRSWAWTCPRDLKMRRGRPTRA